MKTVPMDEAQLPAAVVRFLQADTANEAKIERAYRRFAVRRLGVATAAGSRPLRPLLAAFCAGILLSVGSLYAATSAPWHLLGFRTEKLAKPAPSSAPRAKKAVPAPRPPEAETQHAPAAAQVPSSTGPSVTPERAAAPDSSAAALETWRRAAAGMREQDYDTASDALLKLSQQGSRGEREAARLVRAHLLLEQGRAAEAQPILDELRASAESPLIRRKAGELLALPSPPDSSRRSFEPVAPTNPP